MAIFDYGKEAITISRDAGYNIAMLLTSENRKKSREIVQILIM